ncbi:hypothetical protein HP550_05560 [Cellulomonas humilata]|uniref:Integral membrane protein n=1 Tax=Cellulomonas humilata TaxID=144055 RepID=A0A7Y6A1F0_9CELL|nr:hypothetical protein [Cellulomonas humilata]NUU16714.1 hypothetical protein [Cellulomonas humilata]
MTLPPPARARGRLLALLLLVVSPVCAEYLQAYDPASTGDAAALLGGLLVLAPLYGAPALLIRETAVRARLHWTGILALAGAFGVLQAGVIDQSLFATSYLGYDDWDEQLRPTLVAPLGFGAASALNFLVGHVVWSFAAPIALVEGLDVLGPRRPWLRAPGLVAAAVLYAAAALLIWSDVRGSGSDQASVPQLVGALAVAAALVVVAVTFGRRTLPAPTGSRVPRPAAVLGMAFVAAAGYSLVPPTWLGVAVGVAILTLTAVVVTRWSRSQDWDRRRVAAVAGGAVVVRALVGFASVSEMTPRPPGGFAQNAVLLALAVALVLAALRGGRVSGPARG